MPLIGAQTDRFEACRLFKLLIALNTSLLAQVVLSATQQWLPEGP